MQQYDYFIKWQMVGLISDIINRFYSPVSSSHLLDLLPLGFLQRKGEKKLCTVQVSLDEYWSYFCNFRCGMNDIIWWHFPQSRQNINTALNSIVERCRDFPSTAKNPKTASQNSHGVRSASHSQPDEYAWANYHNEVALNRELYNAILTSNNAN